jgi:DNA-binding NtrC family response regulator
MGGVEAELAERTVLVVDEVAATRRVIAGVLRLARLRTFLAIDPYDGWTRFAEVRPEVVVIHLRAPGDETIGLVRRIRAVTEVPILVLTGSASIPLCERTMLAGASRFLELDASLGELGRLARAAIEGRGEGGRNGPGNLMAIRREREDDLRAQLERLVRECQGNIARVADRLQKDRSTVTYHLKRLGLFDPMRRRRADSEASPPPPDA